MAEIVEQLQEREAAQVCAVLHLGFHTNQNLLCFYKKLSLDCHCRNS